MRIHCLLERADWICPSAEVEGVATVIDAYLDARLPRMIDLKAARADPDTWRAALARKGAGEAFDTLLAADESWRSLVPRVDDLRSRTKLKGKPTPEQLEELQQVKEDLRAAEEELAAAETARDDGARARPEPATRFGARRRHRRTTPRSCAASASHRCSPR